MCTYSLLLSALQIKEVSCNNSFLFLLVFKSNPTANIQKNPNNMDYLCLQRQKANPDRMRAKKGTRMAAATELLFVQGLDGSVTVVTGPEVTHTQINYNECSLFYYSVKVRKSRCFQLEYLQHCCSVLNDLITIYFFHYQIVFPQSLSMLSQLLLLLKLKTDSPCRVSWNLPKSLL